METLIQTISNTPHPMLVLVLIGLSVFMAAGFVVYTVDYIFNTDDQKVDAVKKSQFDKIKKKSNIREA